MKEQASDDAAQQHAIEPFNEIRAELPLILRVFFSENGTDLIIHAQCVLVPRHGEEIKSLISFEPVYFPLDAFQGEHKIDAYIEAVKGRFDKLLLPGIGQTALEEVLTAINMSLADVELPGDKKRLLDYILKSRLQAQAQSIKSRLGMRGRGRHSKWTKTTLLRELKPIVRTLPKSGRNLNNIYAAFKAKHPETEPSSPQSLKQLIYRVGLDLKTIKNSPTKGRVNTLK